MTGLLITCVLLAAAAALQSTRASRAGRALATERRRTGPQAAALQAAEAKVQAQAQTLREWEPLLTALRADLTAAQTSAAQYQREAERHHATFDLQCRAVQHHRDRARRSEAETLTAFGDATAARLELEAATAGTRRVPVLREGDPWRDQLGELGVTRRSTLAEFEQALAIDLPPGEAPA